VIVEFAQYDLDISPAVSLSASGRVDVHSEYGTFFGPRVSALLRSGAWTSRMSVDLGWRHRTQPARMVEGRPSAPGA
jgi:outer membrane receptor for ferrienterochelin and colicin